MSDTIKYTAIVKIAQGSTPKAIAEELDISYAKVLRWKNEYVIAKQENGLKKLLKVDEDMLAELSAQFVGSLPAELAEASAEATEGLSRSVGGLQKLSIELQATAITISNRIRVQVMSVDSPIELTELTKSLCLIQEAFFNSKSTQVNVQNNYTPEAASYGEFLGDKPGG